MDDFQLSGEHRALRLGTQRANAANRRLARGAVSAAPGALDAATTSQEAPPAPRAAEDRPEDDTIFLWPPDLFDVHSHLFLTRGELFLADSPANLDELIELMDDCGISRMAISGFYEPSGSGEEEEEKDSSLPDEREAYIAIPPSQLDQVVRSVHRRHPERFFPFTRGFELDDPDAVAYVCSQLQTGEVYGVGELIVHGHSTDHEGAGSVMSGIYRAAAQYGVPVLVHWDIGGIDVPDSIASGDPSDKDAWVRAKRDANIAELETALGDHANTTFILAHCGEGPAHTMTRDDAALISLLRRLLETYDNLYLDIAGMTLMSGSDPTPWGEEVQALIEDASDRVMLGFDFESSALPDRESAYKSTVSSYLSFLSQLDDGILEVANETAEALITPARRYMAIYGVCTEGVFELSPDMHGLRERTGARRTHTAAGLHELEGMEAHSPARA